ncbi:MAG: DNA-binding protein, partial [Novosphingobium sp.]
VYHKLGGRVVYAIEDLQAWAELGTRRSTSDPVPQATHSGRSDDGLSSRSR